MARNDAGGGAGAESGVETGPELGPDSGTDPDLSTTFTLLSDPTRVDIVRELAASDPDPVRFSDLRHRVGADDAGRFNYHLGRLRGALLEKDQDGYVLTAAGRRAATMVAEPLAVDA